MMRLIVRSRRCVWSVEITRWPVSAAFIAVSIVSASRISPTRITSGSCRSAARALLKLGVGPISRWVILEHLSRWRNSIGSSMVMMCVRERALMWSTIAASVVDLPEPVTPVTRTSPRSSSAISSRTGGRFSSSMAEADRDGTPDDRDRPALPEGVDAEARGAGDGEREVHLTLVHELLALGGLLQEARQSVVGTAGLSSLQPGRLLEGARRLE